MAELLVPEFPHKRASGYLHAELLWDERDATEVWKDQFRHAWRRTFKDLRTEPDPERVRYRLMLRRVEEERKAFDAMLPELIRNKGLVGRYVAVVSGSVVDSDSDDQRLAARMFERIGEQPMFIGYVGFQPKIAQVPSPLRGL